MINKSCLIKTSVVLIVTMCCSLLFSTVSYASGNNTPATATEITDDQSYYSTISSTSDVDWYKIKFNITGTANFYLGSVPSNCDYELEVYKNNGTTLLANSALGGNGASETIRCRVNANQYYYLKVIASSHQNTSDTYLIRGKVYSSTSGKIFSFNYTVSDGHQINSTPSAQVAMNYIWNMKYSGSVYENNAASTAYNSMLGTSIFCVINHANAGYISFSKPVSGSTAVETSYLCGSSSVHPSVSQYITNTRLSEMELAIYAGCCSGCIPASGTSLISATLSAGAKNCIGFTEEINIGATHCWIEKFFQYCRDGYTDSFGDTDYSLYGVLLGATEYIENMYGESKGLSSYVYGNSKVFTTVIGGNY